MNRNPNRSVRASKWVLAAMAGVLGFAVAGGTALADPPWAHDGWHGHHDWHHRDDDDGWRGGYAGPPVYYPAPPPVYYAPPPPPPVYYAPPPPAYYGPPSLSFGINVPLNNR
ncbi:MAG: hypothetical protein PHT60_14580 [Acidiphilium sp.]|nr:hypothetical protein [Acidiphilium sp.]MDD4936987.1 hypothetical protein [Acidiphilium sp.]